jgi:Protein of unknown function (DUF3102)
VSAIVEPIPIVRAATRSIAEIARSIKSNHQKHENAIVSALEVAVEIGRDLFELKKLVPHDEWQDWCKANLPFSGRQAQRYMRAYREWDRLKDEPDAPHLTLKGALEILADPREPESPKTTPGTVLDYRTETEDAPIAPSAAQVTRDDPTPDAFVYGDAYEGEWEPPTTPPAPSAPEPALTARMDEPPAVNRTPLPSTPEPDAGYEPDPPARTDWHERIRPAFRTVIRLLPADLYERHRAALTAIKRDIDA